ncbi:MAG: RHS repeat-associated core domain-containing protein, partial [Acidobacteriota bacterium]
LSVESARSARRTDSPFAASAAEVVDSGVPGWRESRVGHLIRHRYLSPELGRFLQPDPLGYADSMSLYQGFGNNPGNMTDPLGLKFLRPPEEVIGEYLRLTRGGFSHAIAMEGLELYGYTDKNRADNEGWIKWFMITGPPSRLAEKATPWAIAVSPAGDATDAASAIAGRDLVTNEKLSKFERAVTAAAAVLPFVGGKTLREVFKKADDLIDVPSSAAALDVSYVVDDAGLTVRAEGRITGPHRGRGKGYRPEPVGERVPGEHRGHLIPEGGVDQPGLVNVCENIISETAASNLGPKKVLDNLVSRIAAENPNSVVRVIAEPLRRVGETRPFAVTYWIEKDGVRVTGQTILNK